MMTEIRFQGPTKWAVIKTEPNEPAQMVRLICVCDNYWAASAAVDALKLGTGEDWGTQEYFVREVPYLTPKGDDE